MPKKAKGEMTTIKVSVQTAAILANTVRRLKAQGQKSLTADKLLLSLLEQSFPEDVRLMLSPPEDKFEGDNN